MFKISLGFLPNQQHLHKSIKSPKTRTQCLKKKKKQIKTHLVNIILVRYKYFLLNLKKNELNNKIPKNIQKHYQKFYP